MLGVNGRGTAHIGGFMGTKGVQVAVLCDPDRVVLERRAKEFQDRYGMKVETETDLRKVYERKDVDVVGIATPNHWHALATIWACQAGKDVYVEKPGSHNIFEGRKMVEAAKKYNRIVQHGVQLRSSEAVREAVDHLKNGTIGKVYMARGLVFRRRPSIGHAQDPDTAPKTLDWNLWQGPAQERAFSKRIVHYNWHWHWTYGNGDVGNQGIHETDMCLWGLGLNTLPTDIVAMGGKFLWDDDKETPELLSSNYYFPDTNQMIEFEVRPWATNEEAGAGVGNIFYGSEGYLVIRGYNTYATFLGQKGEPGPKRSDNDPLGKHFANFIEAVRKRDTSIQHGPVETAHTASGLAHLGNIAYRLGRKLKFDPKTEKFVGDSEADQHLTRNYRAPFVVPENV
ncbi:MAG: Gfo/Idh/MocA family oxidoreductase [Isosphaeraceae bacterium]